MKYCHICSKPLDYRHDDQCNVRHPVESYDLSQPSAEVQPQLPAPAITAELARAVINEIAAPMRKAMDDIAEAIMANNRMMQTMDLPMEAIAGAHERAQASFETLRKEMLDGGFNQLERVLDTSGLSAAASQHEKRFEEVVSNLDKKIEARFSDLAKDMVAVLNLLQRLHSRELHKAKNRIRPVSKTRIE